jgi:hypothetical protein
MKNIGHHIFSTCVFALGATLVINCGGQPAGKIKKDTTAATDTQAVDQNTSQNPNPDASATPNPGVAPTSNNSTSPEEGWCTEICDLQITCVGAMNCQGVNLDAAGCVTACTSQVNQDIYNSYMAATCDDINTGACQQDPSLTDVCDCPEGGASEQGSCTDASLVCAATDGGEGVCVTSSNAAPATAAICDGQTPCAQGTMCVAFQQDATSGYCLEDC